ncbi:MAG: 4Fe-4S binding protein [Oscillospiraceae bacterium]|jgi:ferredoxin|nr:4Fe-4S binding protein [Oscillospiraceae bacterium]
MYVIGSDCIACGACADSCPAGAISMGDERYEISQDMCISCGACIDTCPTGAISEQ